MDDASEAKDAAAIWHMLLTADNFLKFGADARAIERARKRYGEALAAAEGIGDAALVEQAKRRIDDLGAYSGD
ncbi:MAG: hypothetical protein ABR507_04275 [Actinomycetota bacterium]|nr:hypothetical protein [Actinomycetota bacterium]